MINLVGEQCIYFSPVHPTMKRIDIAKITNLSQLKLVSGSLLLPLLLIFCKSSGVGFEFFSLLFPFPSSCRSDREYSENCSIYCDSLGTGNLTSSSSIKSMSICRFPFIKSLDFCPSPVKNSGFISSSGFSLITYGYSSLEIKLR